jgi:hypothetical protein
MPAWREGIMGLTDRIFEIIGRQTRKHNGWLGKIFGHSMAWEHKPLIKWAITGWLCAPGIN